MTTYANPTEFILRHRPPAVKPKNRCPRCDANLDAIRDMLAEGKLSENWHYAMHMIESCSGCREHFAKRMA